MPETLSSAPNGKGPASQGKATVEARKSKKSCTRKRTGSNGEKTTTHPKSAATTAHGASARRVPVPHCRSAGKENKIGDLSLTVNTREASIPGKSSHQQRRKSSAASVGTTATLTMHQHRKLQEKLDRLDRLMRLPLDLFQDLGTCNQLSGGEIPSPSKVSSARRKAQQYARLGRVEKYLADHLPQPNSHGMVSLWPAHPTRWQTQGQPWARSRMGQHQDASHRQVFDVTYNAVRASRWQLPPGWNRGPQLPRPVHIFSDREEKILQGETAPVFGTYADYLWNSKESIGTTPLP